MKILVVLDSIPRIWQQRYPTLRWGVLVIAIALIAGRLTDSAGAGDAGLLQYRVGHPHLAPRGVADALALAVDLGGAGELLLE